MAEQAGLEVGHLAGTAVHKLLGIPLWHAFGQLVAGLGAVALQQVVATHAVRGQPVDWGQLVIVLGVDVRAVCDEYVDELCCVAATPGGRP
eukprot:CAMPEP_0181254792 /NCGR_PEP_ID=MMETSP1096-20121128/48797_1 /TAXON_ID=156174 ORGANISM="Chrysochromulina ericina, Strain CCMP281" /NCGR_SAMPLE_ID=MMETSP1096 /ASSEMBLY_ACC=CAM_ASM_000453 /LENGTH=90 /DNA_ID=CAMNT_0023352861 /DNA_START=207 /DNA_END=480 /DNA_ORIENTATION=+